MNMANDVSSFKGFAVQSVRDTVKESYQHAYKAAKGHDLPEPKRKPRITLDNAVKSFKKAANKLELRGVQ
jgi:hypothetical protein